MEGERPMTGTPFTKFIVDDVEGITFTARLDPNETNWLLIEGHNRAGELVTRTGIAVTPDPIEDIPVTPEPVVDPQADLAADAEDHLIEQIETEEKS